MITQHSSLENGIISEILTKALFQIITPLPPTAKAFTYCMFNTFSFFLFFLFDS